MSGITLQRFRSHGLLLILFVCVAVLGCGPSEGPTGTVKGTVTLDGEAYSNAAVVFLSPTTGQGGSADVGATGAFTLPEPIPVGSYTVFLAPKSVDESNEPAPVSIDQSVPDKYWNEADSDITIEVAEGENNVTVALTK